MWSPKKGDTGSESSATKDLDTPEKEKTADEDRIEWRAKLVAERAYEKFQARGGEDGHDCADWLAAEAEVAIEDWESEQVMRASPQSPRELHGGIHLR